MGDICTPNDALEDEGLFPTRESWGVSNKWAFCDLQFYVVSECEALFYDGHNAAVGVGLQQRTKYGWGDPSDTSGRCTGDAPTPMRNRPIDKSIYDPNSPTAGGQDAQDCYSL